VTGKHDKRICLFKVYIPSKNWKKLKFSTLQTSTISLLLIHTHTHTLRPCICLKNRVFFYSKQGFLNPKTVTYFWTYFRTISAKFPKNFRTSVHTHMHTKRHSEKSVYFRTSHSLFSIYSVPATIRSFLSDHLLLINNFRLYQSVLKSVLKNVEVLNRGIGVTIESL